MKPKINWNALVSAILSFMALVSGVATAVQQASYTGTDFNILKDIIPTDWMPKIFVVSAFAKLIVSVWPHLAQTLNNIFYWNLPTTVPPVAPVAAIQPQAGALQPTISKT